VIELLSLSREGNGRRGRISYSQLGINQLGAVYEGLLSYTGFLVEENDGLYEVKPAGEPYDPLKQAYFVPKSALPDYNEEEKVYRNGRLVHHAKGDFVYRLAGRNRQKSASYYTPEVLTRCVVKYALKELLKDKKADDILRLTICEPALGSGAFLNEAVNQLSDAYLERKERETGRKIGHDESRQNEKQKVKAYLADNCVFGVDRNPVAIQLAEISLWLNTIYEHHTIPWFGAQLVAGNSLIGARRQVFSRQQLVSDNREWLDSVPERVPMGKPRSDEQVWHFLVPDKGMADYIDKAVKEMLPAEMKQIRDWRRGFCKRFSASDVNALQRLSVAVDRLWEKHAEELQHVRRETAHVFPIFSQESNPEFAERGQRLTTHERQQMFDSAINPKTGNASPYQRLKLAMDYWCALWFWPIEDARMLPSRDEFLLELSAILEGTSHEVSPLLGAEQQPLFQSGKPEQEQLRIREELGTVDLNEIRGRLPRLQKVCELADRNRFLHWELEFAELFKERGGFDLILGNPPWIRIEWDEGGVLGDKEPSFVLRKLAAPAMRRLRDETLQKYPELKGTYLLEYVEFEGAQSYLNSKGNYPLLLGSAANSYKCFLTQAWTFGSGGGVQGFLHQEGPYDDPNGGALRRVLYPRLRTHLQFQNGLNLFADIAHREKYSVNIYAPIGVPHFVHVSNLFHPSTADASFAHDGTGICAGIKNAEGEWNLTGHRDRIIEINEEILELFAHLYDDPGTPPRQARLPSLHARGLVDVLEILARYPRRLGDYEGQYFSTQMWNETISVDEGTLLRQTCFPELTTEWIISGPHIHVGNPLFKTPRRICSEKNHYDPLDLTKVTSLYLPRTNYVLACDANTYRNRTPRVTWDDQKPVTDFYRFVARRQLSQAGERTLIPAIASTGSGHIHPVVSVAFKHSRNLAEFAGASASLIFDFFIKTTAKSDLYESMLRLLPFVEQSPALTVRALLLNCLSVHYAGLFQDCWQDGFRSQNWSKSDLRLNNSRFSSLSAEWRWETPLRTDYERRQALVEIDALVARVLGLSLDQLCTIYRLQFPVLQQNEKDTWYDQQGRIVFTCSKALPGVGFSRPAWEDIKEMKSGTVCRKIVDDTMPGGPRERVIEYFAPFDCCDREEDYATAWKFFDQEGL
jgi:hypothetical protein